MEPPPSLAAERETRPAGGQRFPGMESTCRGPPPPERVPRLPAMEYPTPRRANYPRGASAPRGQIPKEIRDIIATQGEKPGDACNGHTGFLAGGGSE